MHALNKSYMIVWMYKYLIICVNIYPIMHEFSINTVEGHGMIFHLFNFIINTNLTNIPNKCDGA
jgi:hypothetical protein